MCLEHKIRCLTLGKKIHVCLLKKFPCFKLHMKSCLTRDISWASHLTKEETLPCVGCRKGRDHVEATLSLAKVPPGCGVRLSSVPLSMA